MNSNNSKDLISIVGILAFGSMAATRVCDSMLVDLTQVFGISLSEAARTVSWYSVTYGIFQLFYGPLSDRLGKLRVVMSAGIACAILAVATALSPNYWSLVICRMLMGAATAGIIPLSLAWIGDQFPYEQRQEALAKLLSTAVFGMMLGQWLGGFAAEVLHWRVAFFVVASVFLLGVVLLWLRGRAEMAPPAASAQAAPFSLKQYAQTLMELLRIPGVRWVLGASLGEGVLVYGAMAYVPSWLVEQYGMSLSNAGATMICYGLGGLIYSRFAGRWISLLGERGLVLTGGSAILLTMIVLGAASTPWMGAAACVFAGTGFYMLHNTLQVHATQMAPARRGMAVSLFASILFLGQSVGVSLLGLSIGHFSLGTMFWICGVSALLMTTQIARVVRPRGAAS